MLAAAPDTHGELVTWANVHRTLNEDTTVNFRRIGVAAPDNRAILAHFVDQNVKRLPHAACKFTRADGGLVLHETLLPFLCNLRRHRVRQRIGWRPRDRRIGKTADAVEFGFRQKLEQRFEIAFGLAGETDDKGASDHQLGTDCAPRRDARKRVFRRRGPTHGPEDLRTCVLERNVEIGQHSALGH